MTDFEVPTPIVCSPYEEPDKHWFLQEGVPPELRPDRRPAMYFYHPPSGPEAAADAPTGIAIELKLVNLVRTRVKQWRAEGWPGVSGTTLELLEYWRRDGRQQRLFFAQLEATETIVFLTEARRDYLQGIDVPLDEPSLDRKADGVQAFRRYAAKMATGSGKTTVMGMLAAWNILNKVHRHANAAYSDVVLIVCPNVTIRNRLAELDPHVGDASLYRTRDLVPAHLMPDLAKGRVLVTNWHVFEPHSMQAGGVSARVLKTGVRKRIREFITIGPKTTVARGKRYVTQDEFERQRAAGLIDVLEEELDATGNLKRVFIEAERYVESDAAVVNRVLGRQAGSKQNILVFNDEAHHAYRIRKPEPDADEEDVFGERLEVDEFYKEATVWIEGLDRVHKLRRINFCVDLSATPYYLGRVGQDANRPFPWVVSDFGLTDAIESGLVKIPQLAVRDTTGREIPGYFNIWRWIVPQLTAPERGGRRGSVKPEAILKWASTPIAMLAGLWEELRAEWESQKDDPRPPVFIIVCKNTAIAKVVFEWLAEDRPPVGIPKANVQGFRNTAERTNTIRVDSKVVHETDSDQPKSDEALWMRLTLDTVGKTDWPYDRVGRPIYPEGFEELARKRPGEPLHPPGRDVRCIVSVGMLTEGWDCNTVTHIVGLRPFMSQLLCEQVVGRGLRRRTYDVGEDGRLTEEVAKVFGVPFQVVPFKTNAKGPSQPRVKRHHVYALPARANLEIRFPRVEGYRQAVRNRISVDWSDVPPLWLDPMKIPPEVQMKAALSTNAGRPSLMGPGRLENVDLNPYRAGRREQELVFQLARDLAREYLASPSCEAPPQVLFPQLVRIAERFVTDVVRPVPPAHRLDLFLSPYYGWAIERLVSAIRPDMSEGEPPEIPRYESSRGPGSTAEVDYWTSKDVREVVHSHLNYIVADTKVWEQSAAYILDTHSVVESFVKNAGLGFAIPYLHNGRVHDYQPDFIARLAVAPQTHLILETKGFDDLAEVKAAAAERWVAAVNADAQFGRWEYVIARSVSDVRKQLDRRIPSVADASVLSKPRT
ncbi:MAG: DEAD/DEAH box helicase family protein [Acidobacteria bacterium]|nr:DEAD/DEAH box helicase family protein [Acidobacteriota bacterium]MCA1649919.1 DEAD/DEAH box helicase family protein [Acidobacteriota bacterium]